MLASSLRWTLCLFLLVVLIGHLTEGKRGGGGGRSGGGRGFSGARSSSRSSSHSSSSRSWFGGSKSSSSKSSGKSWWSSSKSSSSHRSGSGYSSSSGSGWGWSSSKPRPSVSRDTVSRGIFTPSYGSYGPYYGSGCPFGGCHNTYAVYHYYPRSHYHSRRTATTTTGPIGPKADQVLSTINSNDTLIYNEGDFNGTEIGNDTDVMVILEPSRPLLIQDLAFFWDAKYLPAKDTKGCPSYFPANSNTSISYCDVKNFARCQRDLKELPVYKNDTIFFKDGTNPTHMAWLCPAGTTCCEWECCHEEEGWGFSEIALVLVFGFIILYYGYKCCFSCCLGCLEDWEDRKFEKERERLNRGA